ncbi:MAG: hypothetical protein IJP54_03050 [Synergistaceae bacterium]|nr:hypothetical protein [Synergistaceae bacterium]MBR0034634.1 hypothetical protein [Synergistaceae bacterium]
MKAEGTGTIGCLIAGALAGAKLGTGLGIAAGPLGAVVSQQAKNRPRESFTGFIRVQAKGC